MENYLHAAGDLKPDGYYAVKEGRIRPSDLVYSWTTREYLRHDDPSWNSSAVFADEAVAVLREAKAETEHFPHQRKYKLQRGPVAEPQPDETVTEASVEVGQGSLFTT